MRRGGRPSLLGTAARTAVIAGTATKVGQSVSRSAHAQAQTAADADAYRLQQAAAAQTAVAPPAPPNPHHHLPPRLPAVATI